MSVQRKKCADYWWGNIHSLYEKDYNDIAQGIDWEKMKTFV